MLILTRKIGESIVIDGGITISVVQIKGKQVRLGIDAPSHSRIHRKEIFLNPHSESSLEDLPQDNAK